MKLKLSLFNYSCGPNNGVVLNKRVGLGFFATFNFVGENASWWENFKPYYW